MAAPFARASEASATREGRRPDAREEEQLFVGHFGLGLVGKTVVPKVSLGTLFLSVQLADALWPILLLLGLEHVRIVPGLMPTNPYDFFDYPISHSLVALLGWSMAFAALFFAIRRDWVAAGMLPAGVVSHWFLDALVHRPDMPVLLRGPYLGLGLWKSIPATLAVEGGLYATGIALYLKATRARDRIGSHALWTLLLLAALWLGGLFARPPPDEKILALSALAGGGILIPWAYWIDRHRQSREPR